MTTHVWRIAGISFDHMHMLGNLRMAYEHPRAEIVGICDPDTDQMSEAADAFDISDDHVFTDWRECLENVCPDIVLLCPATARHADWTERVAPYGAHIIMEKPFAASLAEADRMIAAAAESDRLLAINWPLAWYPPHRTTKRLIDEGAIGEVREVHYYDGNRGPMRHVADRPGATPEQIARDKGRSWFYQRAQGGGSLLDYLGYGVTLATWFQGGRAPIEVVAMSHTPELLEVDEHSVTVARYAHGLSKFETRWGTFTDPWTHQPQPKCGFVVVGAAGAISSYDYESAVRVQTRDCPEGRDVPVDPPAAPYRNPVEYLIDCIERGLPVEGPLSPAVSRVGQQIVDAALASASDGRVVPLPTT